ncbi:MAG: thiamine pyrophosphate-binding protein [Actinomycetota bacterium]
MATPADTTATFCATLVDEFVELGVVRAFVSPGSRSTPMARALWADRRVSMEVFHDERSCAFAALGSGMAGSPALLCVRVEPQQLISMPRWLKVTRALCPSSC